MRDLTYEDFEDIEEDPSWNGLDYLAIVAERATQLYNEEKFQESSVEKKKKKPLFIEGQCNSSKLSKECDMKPSVSCVPILNMSKKEMFMKEKCSKKPIKLRLLLKGPVMEMTSIKENSYIEENCVVKKQKSYGEFKVINNDGLNPVGNFGRFNWTSNLTGSRIQAKTPTNSPYVMPIAFKNCIGELAKGKKVSEGKLVIQKQLFATDCSKTHNRFSIPQNQIREEFLFNDEEYNLSLRDGKKMRAMIVPLIEPSLEYCEVSLRRWNMKKSDDQKSSISYVLCGAWNDIRQRNGLDMDMIMQLWAVRVESNLWFALVRVGTN